MESITKNNVRHSNNYIKKNSYSAKYNIPKLNTYLNSDEIRNLRNLEKLSNKSKIISEKKRDIMNLTLKEFIENWANNNIDIFTDLVKFITNLRNYNGYFNDIDSTGNWTNGILIIVKDFVNIFKKDRRSIYFGVTLILISLLFYFIQITS